MRNLLEITAYVVMFLAFVYGVLCVVGLLFVQGDYQDVVGTGDGCYVVTTYHQNWYPSNNEIISRESICKD